MKGEKKLAIVSNYPMNDPIKYTAVSKMSLKNMERYLNLIYLKLGIL